MGYNTTVVILNDALNEISKDKKFGEKIHDAVIRVHHGDSIAISSGGHCNAATVIETHHADGINLIAVGGNYGRDLGYMGNYRSKPIDLLKSLADSLGYRIVKKAVPKDILEK